MYWYIHGMTCDNQRYSWYISKHWYITGISLVYYKTRKLINWVKIPDDCARRTPASIISSPTVSLGQGNIVKALTLGQGYIVLARLKLERACEQGVGRGLTSSGVGGGERAVANGRLPLHTAAAGQLQLDHRTISYQRNQ